MDKAKKMKKIKIIAVIVFMILFVLYAYISYRAEYLQILEIGEEYLRVFFENNRYKSTMFAGNFVVLFLIISITNILIKKGLKVFFDDEKKEMPKLPNKSVTFIISVIGSVILTSAFLDKIILFINSTWFGINDPVFGMDIGFFFFQKPFIELVIKYLNTILISLAIYTTAYYIIVFNLCLEGVDRKLLFKSGFIKSLKVFAILIITTMAFDTFLGTYNIVCDEFVTLKDGISTKLTGSGITDITIKLW